MTAENFTERRPGTTAGLRRSPGTAVSGVRQAAIGQSQPAPGLASKTAMSGTRAVAALTDRMLRVDAELPAGLRADLIGSTSLHWLIEQYLFSRDARHHVTLVLDHGMSASERELWTWAVRPETWHLPLYRLVFSQLSMSAAEVDALAPTESTDGYLRALGAAAERGPVSCAAAMMVVERRPARLGAPADSCWADLTGQGPFRADAILPLWQEHPAAESSPHDTIGAAVVAGRPVVDGEDLAAALTSVDQVAAAGWAWTRDLAAQRPRRSAG